MNFNDLEHSEISLYEYVTFCVDLATVLSVQKMENQMPQIDITNDQVLFVRIITDQLRKNLT